MKTKVDKAKDLLLQLEELKQAEGVIAPLVLLNEVLRTAKGLAEELVEEEKAA